MASKDEDMVPLSGGVRPKKGPDPQLDLELGISNVLPVGAWLSWLSDGTSDGATIVNTDPVSVDRLTEMLKRDGQARGLYRLLTLPILSALKEASWIAPPDQKGGEKETEFANLMFSLPPSMGGMTIPLTKVARQTLRGLALGYSPFEEVRHVPEDGPLQGMITLQKLAYREPRTIRFRVDETGGYNGLRQLTQVMGRPVDVNIPKEKCLHGDTVIPLLDGTSPTIRELASRSDDGERFWVYSLAPDGSVTPGHATKVWSSGVLKTVVVRLDDGSSLRCTPDHRIAMRDGSYCEAQDLVPGVPLAPLYRRKQKINKNTREYEQVYDVGSGVWRYTHRVVSDAIYGPCATNTVRRRTAEEGRLYANHKVVSVEAADDAEVFDIAVDGLHNFATDSIFVHNSWYWSANEEENPFYGISFFETAFYHYDAKKKLYYIAHLAAQFAAIPGRIGSTPTNPDPRQLKAFKAAIESFAFNTAMVAPEGYKVDPFNGNSTFNFMGLIDHHNVSMATSVLAKFMDQEDRQVLIDNSKGDPSADMFVMMLEAIMHDIAQSWTYYLMPKYIDWNFGTGIYPVFQFGQLTDTAKEVIQEIYTAALAAPNTTQGGNMTPEFFRQLEEKLATRLGLDIDYDAIEQQEQQDAQEQELQNQSSMLAAQSQLNGGPSTALAGSNLPGSPNASPTDTSGQDQGGAGTAIGSNGINPGQADSMGATTSTAAMSGQLDMFEEWEPEETVGGFLSLAAVADEIERRRESGEAGD